MNPTIRIKDFPLFEQTYNYNNTIVAESTNFKVTLDKPNEEVRIEVKGVVSYNFEEQYQQAKGLSNLWRGDLSFLIQKELDEL